MKVFKKEQCENKGAIALIMVIMITAITIVSSVVVSLVNISEKQANYHFSESEEAKVDMDACLDDALMKLASSTSASGSFNLDTSSVNCVYQISSIISDGLKVVTSTASSTSDVGFWESEIIALINVSTTPISINSYKNNRLAYSSYAWCGDSSCSRGETCSTCSADCGTCQVCGNGTTEGTEVCDDGNTTTEMCGDAILDDLGPYCNATCTASYDGGEVWDDGNTVTEACGDGVKQNGTYSNADCSATIVRSEVCDYTGAECTPGGQAMTSAVGCTKNPYCTISCGGCTSVCL